MINLAEGKGVLFRDLASCLGVCENYTMQEQTAWRELGKKEAKRYLFYLVNSSVSLTGFCAVNKGELYTAGEVGIYGLEIYPCKSGTTKPCRIIEEAKVRSLYDIAKENSVNVLRVQIRPSHPRDLCFFAKRVPSLETDVVQAIRGILKSQEKADKFAKSIRR